MSNTLSRDILSAFLATSLSRQGAVFTNARESAAAVAGAENLKRLASMLSTKVTDLVSSGTLLADGQQAAVVQVAIDGTLVGDLSDGFDTSGRAWTLQLRDGPTLRVAFFAGEFADDERWVIDDAEAFYGWLMGQ